MTQYIEDKRVEEELKSRQMQLDEKWKSEPTQKAPPDVGGCQGSSDDLNSPTRLRRVGPLATEQFMDQPDTKETDDPLFDAMAEHWEQIVAGYKQFEDKRPVMLYDIQENRIYAYPYEDFKNDMSSAKSQASLAEQYELARRAGTMVVFVRDNEARRLASYSMDYK